MDLFSEKEVTAEIKVTEKNGLQMISARELYARLEISDRFSRWFDSLLKYGFEESFDFWSVKTSTQQNQYGGIKELDDFAITIEMAKQICMLQRSEKGKQYREYFIRLEKAWNTPEAVMARALQVANNTIENAKKQIALLTVENKENRAVIDRIANGNGCFSMNQTAKALKLPYGNIKLYERLRNERILNLDNSPKQEYVNAGYFKVVVKHINESVGNKPVTLVTGKGLVWLAKKLNAEIDESVKADCQ